MKIAFFIESISGGGAERVTVNLANEMIQSFKVEIILVTGKREREEYKINKSIQREILLSKKIFYDRKIIKKYLDNNNVDIAIGMGIYTNLCLCSINRKLDTKIVISERNSPKHDNISWKSKFLRALLYQRADGYVFQTREAQSYYSKKIQKRSVIIHNPIKGVEEKCIGSQNIIVAVGRLVSQKNFSLLIKAMKKVSDIHNDYKLVIYGNGREREKLMELIIQLDMEDKVVLEDFCNNVHEKMKVGKIFAMSSDFEGMPNALLEAMAMGFPVVCTDCPVGGPKEVIENNVNGILVPINDVDAMASSIINLIENEKMRLSIGENAKKIVETHNSYMIAKQWLNFLESTK